MSNKITYEIDQLNFEKIRENIGQILADELSYQDYTYNLGVTVWNERFIQFDGNEMPAINVAFNKADYEDYTQTARQAVNEYYIDVHANAPHTDTEQGDTRASLMCKRIAGIVSYILMSQEHRLLGFEPGIIQTKWIESMEMGKLSDNDTIHTVVCRIYFKVRANEIVQEIPPVTGEKYTTQIKLGETDKGYYFVSE